MQATLIGEVNRRGITLATKVVIMESMNLLYFAKFSTYTQAPDIMRC